MTAEPGEGARPGRVFEVFDAVCDLPPAERAAVLDERCGADHVLRREVEQLLAADADPATGLEDRHVQFAAPSLPQRIGDYEVLARLGAGGMGVVYEAMQRLPHRKVALKVIRSTLPSHEHLRRFEDEARVLGWLNHPGIATVYEAGSAEVDGARHPYLAMELVVGFPLDAYVRESALGVEATVTLLASVADAVHHAHQKGVIHRDLKPGNVLVDASGQPKVLDFGIARATDADLAPATRHTSPGQILGTLPYMSPEQVRGDPSELDTRADVYALGVVLYELLSGRKPLEVSAVPVAEAARVIAEEEPPALGALEPRLQGDLEVIVHKALEKEKARRYDSAAELAADLRRFLANEPIHARPASAAYQLLKFTRRNRLLVAGAASTLLALVLGLVGTLTFALRAREQATLARGAEASARDAERGALASAREASRQAEVALAVNAFLNEDLLSAVAPSSESGRGRDVRMREVLDVAAERIEAAALPDGRFADKPHVEAEVRRALGNTYARLGELARAGPHLERARLLLERELGTGHLTALASRCDLASVLVQLRELELAEPLLQDTLALAERAAGADAPVSLRARSLLGGLYTLQARAEASLEVTANARELAEPAHGEDDPVFLTALNSEATAHFYARRFAEAEAQYRQVIERGERLWSEGEGVLLEARANLVASILQQGRFEEAEALYADLVVVLDRVLGEEHPTTLMARLNRASLFMARGHLEEAEGRLLDALATATRTLGPEHTLTLQMQNNLAEVVKQLGRHEEAEELLLDTLHTVEGLSGQDPRMRILLLLALVKLYEEQGRWSEIDVLFDELEAERELGNRAVTHEVLHELALVANRRAWTLLTTGEPSTARFERAHALARRANGMLDGEDARILDTLALAQHRTGRTDRAVETQRRALELLAEDHPARSAYAARLDEYLAAPSGTNGG